jgi:hypothetical protein
MALYTDAYYVGPTGAPVAAQTLPVDAFGSIAFGAVKSPPFDGVATEPKPWVDCSGRSTLAFPPPSETTQCLNLHPGDELTFVRASRTAPPPAANLPPSASEPNSAQLTSPKPTPTPVPATSLPFAVPAHSWFVPFVLEDAAWLVPAATVQSVGEIDLVNDTTYGSSGVVACSEISYQLDGAAKSGALGLIFGIETGSLEFDRTAAMTPSGSAFSGHCPTASLRLSVSGVRGSSHESCRRARLVAFRHTIGERFAAVIGSALLPDRDARRLLTGLRREGARCHA